MEKPQKNNTRSHSIQTKKLVTAAVFAALCYVMTMLSIPLPVVGYGNLGDCLVLLSGWLLGPLFGALAAGIGSALADVTLGFGLYAPATFIIKALMAIVAYFVASLLSGRSEKAIRRVLSHAVSAVLGEAVMIGGYFAYECLIYDVAAATGSLLGNATQAIAGAVLSIALITIIRSNKALNSFFKEV